mgnify:CR=1
MNDNTVSLITLLDFMLIMMTAFWILLSLTKTLSFFELVYDIVYVITNITALFLNIRLLRRIENH